METRRLGRTGQKSTVAIFGTAAFWDVTQAEADTVMDQIVAAGVNHIDVAPSYGKAEERLGPWLAHERQTVFLGCKTMERTRAGAEAELHLSLERLHTDHFDLYQLHAVTTFAELDEVTRRGGALEAAVNARQQGLTRFIGITGHGYDSPAIYLEALERFNFDTVMFPLNYVQLTDPTYRQNAAALLEKCRLRDVGVMIIKSIARGPWGEGPKTQTTWYQPWSDFESIKNSINFVLSHDVTGICTAGDIRLLPLVLQACQNYHRLTSTELEALITSSFAIQPLFVPG